MTLVMLHLIKALHFCTAKSNIMKRLLNKIARIFTQLFPIGRLIRPTEPESGLFI